MECSVNAANTKLYVPLSNWDSNPFLVYLVPFPVYFKNYIFNFAEFGVGGQNYKSRYLIFRPSLLKFPKNIRNETKPTCLETKPSPIETT
jgi:hypothetical protein